MKGELFLSNMSHREFRLFSNNLVIKFLKFFDEDVSSTNFVLVRSVYFRKLEIIGHKFLKVYFRNLWLLQQTIGLNKHWVTVWFSG